MAEVHGKHSRMLMDPTGAVPGTPVVVADITGYTFDGSTDTVDVTPLGATNKRSVLGLPNYTGTFTANWNSADLKLLEAALAGTAVTLKLVPDNNVPGTFLSGKAYISTSITTGSSAAVTMDGTFTAADNWTLTKTP
jgi:hypothetical protein